MKKYSLEIADAIHTHIKESELRLVSFDETLGSFSFNMQLACQLSTNIIIRVGEDSFTTMAVCPVRPDTSDAELMARMAEFVCRANFGLKNGNFEFDFTDGELRYKCYIPYALPGDDSRRHYCPCSDTSPLCPRHPRRTVQRCGSRDRGEGVRGGHR